MYIGSKIRKLRIEKGLTQQQLGTLCGMADSAIRRYESDRGNPTEKTIGRIAEALGVHQSDLLLGGSFRIHQPPEQIELGQPTPQEGLVKLGEVLGNLCDTIHDTQTLIFLEEAHQQLNELNGEGVRRAAGYISVLHRDPECIDKIPPTASATDAE